MAKYCQNFAKVGQNFAQSGLTAQKQPVLASKLGRAFVTLFLALMPRPLISVVHVGVTKSFFGWNAENLNFLSLLKQQKEAILKAIDNFRSIILFEIKLYCFAIFWVVQKWIGVNFSIFGKFRFPPKKIYNIDSWQKCRAAESALDWVVVVVVVVCLLMKMKTNCFWTRGEIERERDRERERQSVRANSENRFVQLKKLFFFFFYSNWATWIKSQS